MKPATRRCLSRMLAANGAWISGNELFQVAGTRYGARLFELKHEYGYAWEKRYVRGTRVPQYRLSSEPVQQTMGLAS